MIIKKIIDFEMDQNCYILHNEGCSECILIDPGNSYFKIIEAVKEENLKISNILLTHCHYDHVSSIKKLKEETNAKILASENCSKNIKNKIINVSVMFGNNFEGDFVDKILSDNEEILLAGIKIKCIETPGHTNCSACYLAEKNLFSGDTLFLRTTGRWDLPTGDFETLKNSLKNKIYTLDDEILVYPGHGNSTTIGYEKKFNMSINSQD